MFGNRKNLLKHQDAQTPNLPPGILKTSLLLQGVLAPELEASCLGPVDLALGLQECVLLTGLSAREADVLLRLAATLRRPVAGQIFHWGQDLLALPRRELFPWRGRLAFVSPFQSLLPRMTVLENVTLSQTLATDRSAPEVAREHQSLLTQLGLPQFLSGYPRDLPDLEYHLALWARELIKQPRLILGVLAGREETHGAPELAPFLLPLLEDYQGSRRGAILLAGPYLDMALQLADRRLDCREGRWQEEVLPGRQSRSLMNYLDLL